ncbi:MULTISPECIES: hypothetical protein [unclassified Chelatococcus]|uniref:hypothetical protein n=1 Tax=unclassified Chelatococcus TaxID=2638111 RepID=UPI001BD06588|nr:MULTISPECIES: hypothetical protein [unclassified Chelatococcus]MBS7696211.1 hypothetical protein [Chelatococcus sp. YT9]MBX3557762.1 hypothetical protein [Chelatococcus sp.]
MPGASLLAAAALWAPMAAAAAVEDMIVEEIACLRAPDPTSVLLSLSDEGRIRIGDQVMADSFSCWAFAEPLTIGSMDFSHVCASHEDPETVEQYPALYFRGPGTSPGTSLGLVTGLPSGMVARWASEWLPAEAGEYIVEPIAMIEGGTEISCNSLYRNGAP